MNPRISIDFEPAEGAVVRMLGLIERRGFEVRGIGMTEHDGGGSASMMLELAPRDPSRRVEVLDLQLRRLHGVRDIATFAARPGSTS
jgi:acetolactate synthase regulatory subunit